MALVAGLIFSASACGSEGGPAATASPASADAGGSSANDGASTSQGIDASTVEIDASTEAGPTVPACPSPGTWKSLVPGPGQTAHDPTLAAKVARYDRLHEALTIKDTGLAGTIAVSTDPTLRQKLDAFLGSSWDPTDADPTDDFQQYAGVDPFAFVTQWYMATGMYAGTELAADAFRYGVLRDRGASCNDVARARKVLQIGLDALHVVVDITGKPGSIARSIARNDLAGDGASPVVPLFDGNNQPLPAEKTNGTWRADNSGGKYPNLIWMDSCSRDMLFGWTFGMAAAWEVIKADPSFDAATKARLQGDARAILDALRIVRPSGKDLEIWDPDNRRTFHGNLHETSVDRQYLLKNGVASLMALGEVTALAYVAEDASSKGFLQSLVTARDLPGAINQSLIVAALSGDKSNHSSFNMMFMTAWLASRYMDAPGVRQSLKKPTEQDLYSPLFGDRPLDWKQSFFDFIVAASSGNAWTGGNAAGTYDQNAVKRGLETLVEFPNAPYYPGPVNNCDANEVAAGACLMQDGTTVMDVKVVSGEVVATDPVPMRLRPPSNFFWRTNPHLVNGDQGTNLIFPGSDLRIAYWMGRYVRVN